MRHPAFFPVEINTAAKEELLRVPGIGPKSALRIIQARRTQNLGLAELPAVQKLAARGMAADVAAKTVRQEALQCLTKRM